MGHNPMNIHRSINVENVKRNQKSKMKNESLPIIYITFLRTLRFLPVFSAIFCLLEICISASFQGILV